MQGYSVFNLSGTLSLTKQSIKSTTPGGESEVDKSHRLQVIRSTPLSRRTSISPIIATIDISNRSGTDDMYSTFL